jgi:serine/threonine protein kinase
MKCPCCEAAEVSSATDTCDVCGYSTKATVATAEGGSPDQKAGADPSRTAVKVKDSVECGHVTAITILLKDSYGKRLKSGGDTVVVAVNGANRARPTVTDVKNGSYTATYTPTVAGTDRLSVTLNGVPIAGSPFTVDIRSGPPDANRTTVKAPEGAAGAETRIVIELLDASGNPAAGDDASLEVSVAGVNADAAATVSKQDTGQYHATYLPALTGVDQIKVSLNGKTVAGSPFKTTVKPGASSPSDTEVEIPDRGVSGVGATITIKTRDAYGNEKLAGGDQVSVIVTKPARTKVNVRDIGDGTYTAVYTPTSPGTDEIVVELNGEPVSGSPFAISIESGEPDPSQTTTTIPPAIAGEPTTITITVRDQRGNPLPGRVDGLSVVVSGANTAEPELKESLGGVYSAVYVPTVVGTDQVAIVVSGEEIPGSPFDTNVEAGEMDPEETVLEVPAAGVVGEPVELVVTTFDGYGNALQTGGARVELIVTGANDGVATDVNDRGDGTYSLTYTPKRNGEDQLTLAVNDVDVTEEPATVAIETGPASPAETTVKLGHGRAGVETYLTIVTHDSFGNPLSSGGESITMQVAGANERIDVTVRDNGDGSYSANYLPTEVGVDYVTVSLNGEMIADSPCKSNVEPGPGDAEKTTATAPSSSRAGSLTNVSITVNDAYGNRVPNDEHEIAVTISGPNGGAEVTVEGSKGSYLAKFTPIKAGTDEISISLSGTPIGDSPVSLEIEAADVDPLKSDTQGPDEGRVGEPYAFVVTARDKFGNCCGKGGHDVQVTVTGVNDSVPVEVTDKNDGTYGASYEPKLPGADRISVQVNDVHIGGDPLRPKIKVGGASTASTVEVPDGRAGKATTIKITARDAAGNALTSGGDRVVVNVSVANSNTPTVEDHGDGTYVAVYTPTHVGSDYVNVTLNGKPLKGGPFISKVIAGPLDAGRTRVTVPSSGVAGRSSEILIHARDLHGNEIQHGGQQFRVSIEGVNDASTAQMTDRNDGTYVASYTPTKTGTDYISLTLPGDEVVGGGEYKSEVEPGAPSTKQTTAVFPDGIVGMLTRVSVTVRDTYRNRVPAGDKIQLKLEGANQENSLQVTDHRDGTFTATYTPTASGEDRLIVLVEGEIIAEGELEATVHAGPGASDRALVEVDDGVCGEETLVLITARDEFGNVAKRGGDIVIVSVEGANAGAKVRCVDNGDGTYEANYTPIATGTDLVVVQMNGSVVEKSPFKSQIRAGPVDSSRCEIDVPAGTVGVETTAQIITRDAYNNRIETGGVEIVARVEGANVGTFIDVVDYDNGTYTVRYTPGETGVDTIDVTINDRPIAGNPFSSVVGARTQEEKPREDLAVVDDLPVVDETDEIEPEPEEPDSVDEEVTQVIPPVAAVAEAPEPEPSPDITDARTVEIQAIAAAPIGDETVELDAIPVGAEADEIDDGASEDETQVMEPVRPDAPTRIIPRIAAADRSKLHPFVTCPRCSSTTIASDGDRCDLCGWEVATLVATRVVIGDVADDDSPGPPTDIDEKVALELRDQFNITTVLTRGDTWLLAVASFPDVQDPVLLRIAQRPEAQDEVEGFRRDAGKMKTVKHPRIIPLLRAGATDSLMWYSTRLVRGQTLSTYLQTSGPLPAEAGVRIFQQITDALEYLHRSGLYHGSITTNSIVLDENSEAWLSPQALTGFEATGEAARFEYMPPECFRGHAADARADQYALAVCAYESLSGAKPFSGGKTAEDFASLHEQRIPPRVSELRRELPLHVATAIERAMDRDPGRRFGSILDLGKALSAPSEITPLRVPKRTGKRTEPRVFVIERPLRPFPIRRIGFAATLTLMSFGTVEFMNRPQESTWETVEIEGTTDPLQNPSAATIDSLTALLDSSVREPAPPPQRTRPRPPPIDNTPGLLWVNSQPTGQLFIDNQFVGQTPRPNISVPPGTHTLRIVRSGFQDYEQEFQIAPGDSLRITDITLQPR